MRDGLPDRLLSPDGTSGWYAVPPDGEVPAEDEPWSPPPEHSMIRLMGEHTVEVPLWFEGELFNDRAELESHLSLSEALVTDLVAWAAAWQDGGHGAELDREAAGLVRRLNDELGHRYTFVYHP